jgi:hypothetical protein
MCATTELIEIEPKDSHVGSSHGDFPAVSVSLRNAQTSLTQRRLFFKAPLAKVARTGAFLLYNRVSLQYAVWSSPQ